jgi:hypothetical protein
MLSETSSGTGPLLISIKAKLSGRLSFGLDARHTPWISNAYCFNPRRFLDGQELSELDHVAVVARQDGDY